MTNEELVQEFVRKSAENGVDLVGRSKVFQEVLLMAAIYARSDMPVLLTGETGTGKDVFARAIHCNSQTADAGKEMVAVNCGAFPSTLFMSEMFGSQRGAFTDATQNKRGFLEQGDGTTLLLDEVTSIPKECQVALLRALDPAGGFYPLGSVSLRTSHPRIISTTNGDIEQDIKEGRFRQDLFQRLNACKIDLPPLRERKEDIPLLINHFLEHAVGVQKDGLLFSLSNEALNRALDYAWPGNVRELENAVLRAKILAQAQVREEIIPKDFQIDKASSDAGLDSGSMEEQGIARIILQLFTKARRTNEKMNFLDFLGERIIAKAMSQALEIHHGNRKAVQRFFNCSIGTVYYYLKISDGKQLSGHKNKGS